MRNVPKSSYSCWVHGKEAYGEVFYPLIDPSTGEWFAQATEAGSLLVDSSMESARGALKHWRCVSAPQRAEILHRLAHLLDDQRDSLASLLSKEVGKPLPAAGDEVLSAASLIDYFAEECLRLKGEIPLLGYDRERVLIVREPVGVVAAITPFNYPLSTLACKMAPALAAGCTLVVKPDEHTPLSTLEVARLALEAGVPPGVFNVLTGPGPTTGRMMVEHSIPRLITFTGSTEVGKEIQRIGARTVRRAILELGGNCPAIVCEDAPWRDLLPQLVVQSLKNSGQYCYRTSRIYVAESIYTEFLAEFVKHTRALRIGPPDEAGVDLGPLNNEDVLARVQSQVGKAVAGGAKVRCGGNTNGLPPRGFYYPPTVLTEVPPQASIMFEEVFGPVVIIRALEDMRKAIDEANGTCYGLAAYVFTRDLAMALEWADLLEMGSVWINRIHQAYPEAPFGGMKESGLGREKSHFGLEEFTELKTLYLSY